MSVAESGTDPWADQIINQNSQILGYSVANDFGNERIMLRNVSNGQFAYATDRWDFFRENYETLRAAGAF